MPQLSKTYRFRLTEKQAETLSILKKKYRYNTAQFVRDAISEKLDRERKSIVEVKKYFDEMQDCPF